MNLVLEKKECYDPPAVAFPVRYRSVTADGIKASHREAGKEDSPTLLLLHGFPTACYIFLELNSRLVFRFRDRIVHQQLTHQT
jgi:pimeloyl-ACP methyl ester carboxylesterase